MVEVERKSVKKIKKNIKTLYNFRKVRKFASVFEKVTTKPTKIW